MATLDIGGTLGFKWQLGQAWATGHRCYDGTFIYGCLRNHTSTSANRPGTIGGSTFWQVEDAFEGYTPSWERTQSADVGFPSRIGRGLWSGSGGANSILSLQGWSSTSYSRLIQGTGARGFVPNVYRNNMLQTFQVIREVNFATNPVSAVRLRTAADDPTFQGSKPSAIQLNGLGFFFWDGTYLWGVRRSQTSGSRRVDFDLYRYLPTHTAPQTVTQSINILSVLEDTPLGISGSAEAGWYDHISNRGYILLGSIIYAIKINNGSASLDSSFNITMGSVNERNNTAWFDGIFAYVLGRSGRTPIYSIVAYRRGSNGVFTHTPARNFTLASSGNISSIYGVYWDGEYARFWHGTADSRFVPAAAYPIDTLLAYRRI